MFPTGVGMNRTFKAGEALAANVPHRRGDEPAKSNKKTVIPACSPQAWG